MGRGRVQVEEQAVKSKGPKWRSVVKQGCKEKTAPYLNEEEEP
jgi:hypothetical protein